MSNAGNRRARGGLVWSVGILIVLIIIISASIGWFAGRRSIKNDDVDTNDLAAIVSILEIKANLNFISTYTNRIVNPDPASERDHDIGVINDTAASNTKLYDDFGALIGDDWELQNMYNIFLRHLDEYRDAREELIALVRADNYEDAAEMNADVITPLVIELRGDIEEMVNYILSRAEQ